MIDFREAQRLVLQQAHSFGTETVPLEQALGRVLAETVYADRDYPPFHRASMDGYALSFSDLESGIRRFAIVEMLLAGYEPAHLARVRNLPTTFQRSQIDGSRSRDRKNSARIHPSKRGGRAGNRGRHRRSPRGRGPAPVPAERSPYQNYAPVAGRAVVLPGNRSYQCPPPFIILRAWNTAGRIASSDSRAPSLLPGRVTTSVCPMEPATPLLIMAIGV